jgi:nickel-dependent lactate racemase
VAAYGFFNHDCRAEDLVPVGRLASGAVVRINRRVAEADYRIGIGSIFPHPLNGFGGGGKILFPGVADFDSIFEHHLQHSFRDSSGLGILDGNPFYEEVTAMARAGRLDFIVNSVLDHNDRLHDVVCGDPVGAHRAGAEMCRRIISKRFSGPADVTIISAFPYAEGPQIMKPLAPAEMITRPGGCIILAAESRSPLPEHYFKACERFRSEHAGSLRRAVLDHFESHRPIMPGAPPELNMSMAQVMLALDKYDVILVADGMSPDQVERLGFTAATDLDAAIERCSRRYSQATVNIVPSGGVILPVLPEMQP